MMVNKYNVIYADPPWSYENKSVKGFRQKSNSAVVDKYDLMNMQDLKNMPIKSITDRDCVCFMWAVNPLLPEAFELLKAWGFKYKTMLTWKKNKGTGYWFEGYTEHILLGVKGNIKAFKSGLPNIHECKIGKHSQKPHHFRELISKAVSKTIENPKKLELFARTRAGMFGDYEYEGWDVYGNQVNNSIDIRA